MSASTDPRLQTSSWQSVLVPPHIPTTSAASVRNRILSVHPFVPGNTQGTDGCVAGVQPRLGWIAGWLTYNEALRPAVMLRNSDIVALPSSLSSFQHNAHSRGPSTVTVRAIQLWILCGIRSVEGSRGMKAIHLFAVAWVMCASPAAAQLTIRLSTVTPVPAGRSVHIAGSFNAWNPSGTRLSTDSIGHWFITLPDNVRGNVEVTFTLGSWATVETSATGGDVPNR